jgi:hypothetical protein
MEYLVKSQMQKADRGRHFVRGAAEWQKSLFPRRNIVPLTRESLYIPEQCFEIISDKI